jgi:hypothetical protein
VARQRQQVRPNGKPLSPITTGFTGGGMEGGTFGSAIDAQDNAWFTTYGGHSIAVFDKNGKPLTPPEGITFGGRLGLMQGIIGAPSVDVWALGASKSQLIYFPKGDLTKGQIVCEGSAEEPCKSFLGPFHLTIDQQNRIWVTNAFADHVTRFSAADPSKAENFYVGASPSGLRASSPAWRAGSDHNGLFGALQPVDLIFKLGNLLLSLGQRTRRIRNAINLGHQTVRWRASSSSAASGSVAS